MFRALRLLFESHTPSVENRRCLRLWDRRPGHEPCDLCAAVCPRSAVRFDAGISIDAGRCTTCGLCVSVCPTSAITDEITERRILDHGTAFETVALGCKGGSDQGGTWGVPVEAVCGVSAHFIAAAALQSPRRRVLLDCRYCDNCRVGSGRAHASENARRATHFLESIGASSDIRVVGSHADTEGSRISRRELFRATVGKLRARTEHAARSYVGVSGSSPTARELLWRAAVRAGHERRLTERPPVTEASPLTETLPAAVAAQDRDAAENCGTDSDSPWGAFRVDTRCTACGVCSRTCAWEAWRVHVGETTRSLTFEMSRCRNCGLCVETCPERAIHRVPERFPHPVSGEQEMATATVARCRRCGRAVSGVLAQPEALCGNCAKQVALRLDEAQSGPAV